MVQLNDNLIDELNKERALLIQYEELDRKRAAETMDVLERKGSAVIELLAAYRCSA